MVKTFATRQFVHFVVVVAVAVVVVIVIFFFIFTGIFFFNKVRQFCNTANCTFLHYAFKVF